MNGWYGVLYDSLPCSGSSYRSCTWQCLHSRQVLPSFQLCSFVVHNVHFFLGDLHSVHLSDDGRRAIFLSSTLSLTLESSDLQLQIVNNKGVEASACLKENSIATFVLRKWKEPVLYARRRTLQHLFHYDMVKEQQVSDSNTEQQQQPSLLDQFVATSIEEEQLQQQPDIPTAEHNKYSKYDASNYDFTSDNLDDFPTWEYDMQGVTQRADFLFLHTLKVRL